MRLGQGLAVAVAVVASLGVAQCNNSNTKAIIKANFKKLQVQGLSVYLTRLGNYPCRDADKVCAKFGMRVATVDIMTRDLYVNLLTENNLTSAVVNQGEHKNVVLTSRAVFKGVTAHSLSAVFCVSRDGRTLPENTEPKPPVEETSASSSSSVVEEVESSSTRPCSSTRSTERIVIRPPPRRHRCKHIPVFQPVPPATCPVSECPLTRDILVIKCSFGKIAVVDEYEKYVRNPQLANVMCHKLQPYLQQHMVESSRTSKSVLSNKTSRTSVASHDSSSDSSDSSHSDSYRRHACHPRHRRDVRRYHRRADCNRYGKVLYVTRHKRPAANSYSGVDNKVVIKPLKCRRHKRRLCRKRHCRKYN